VAWERWQLELLVERFHGATVTELVPIVEKTESAIRGMARKLGLRRPCRGPGIQEELELNRWEKSFPAWQAAGGAERLVPLRPRKRGRRRGLGTNA